MAQNPKGRSTHKLSMDITTHGDGASNRLDIRLFYQDFSRLDNGGTRGPSFASGFAGHSSTE